MDIALRGSKKPEKPQMPQNPCLKSCAVTAARVCGSPVDMAVPLTLSAGLANAPMRKAFQMGPVT